MSSDVRIAAGDDGTGSCPGSFRQGAYTFYLANPTYSGTDERPGDFGPYVDWMGICDDIETKLSPPYQRPVIISGRNGTGKDALAIEIARRCRKPMYLTTISRQTTCTSLVLTQRFPLESREIDLSAHTTAQIVGGISVITEGGKADNDFELPLTPQAPAYDGHRRLVWDSPKLDIKVHPEHALLILTLPGEAIQCDIRSRAAVYRLEDPPPDVLVRLVAAGVDFRADSLIEALRDFVSEQQASNRSISPRAARAVLTDAWKEGQRRAGGKISGAEAMRLIRMAAKHVELAG